MSLISEIKLIIFSYNYDSMERGIAYNLESNLLTWKLIKDRIIILYIKINIKLGVILVLLIRTLYKIYINIWI